MDIKKNPVQSAKKEADELITDTSCFSAAFCQCAGMLQPEWTAIVQPGVQGFDHSDIDIRPSLTIIDHC